VADLPADAFLLGGDVGEAPNVARFLNALDNRLGRPVYFVLGDHDFYRVSIVGVRRKVEALCIACPNLLWLPRSGMVPLTDETRPVGYRGQESAVTDVERPALP
jgi:hypothetical protein